MMRRVRYQVACSLDGFIAGPRGEFDWIPEEPDIDFHALFDQFDTLLMGRRTYEEVPVDGPAFQDKRIVVFSRTLSQSRHPRVEIVGGDVGRKMEELRAGEGKDIWLYGGGELFRSLLELGHVDTVEPAIVPILLGGGRPFLPAPAVRCSLTLTGRRVYEKSGIVQLEYTVAR